MDEQKYLSAVDVVRKRFHEPPNDTDDNHIVYLGLQVLTHEHLFEFLEVTGWEYVGGEWRLIDEGKD